MISSFKHALLAILIILVSTAHLDAMKRKYDDAFYADFTIPSTDPEWLDEIMQQIPEQEHDGKTPNKRPIMCPYEGCNKYLSTKGSLKLHIRTHTGERPFKCPFDNCGKAFAQKIYLINHIRTHTGEKPYKCPYDECNKAFIKPYDLKRHIRVHTGEKPYTCPFLGCNQAFSRNGHLVSHIKTHKNSRS